MTFAGSGRTKITAGSRQPGMFTRQPSPRNVSAGGGGENALHFSVASAIFPDGSGSTNNPATLEKIVSSATQTSNSPKVTLIQALFDSSTDEHLIWQFVVPDHYDNASTAQAVSLLWGAKVTTGNVVWKAQVAGMLNLDTDLDAAVWDVSPGSSSGVSVPGTVGQYRITTITQINGSPLTVGELAFLFVGRDANHASDTAAGDATLLAASLRWGV